MLEETQRCRKSYDRNRTFQHVWDAKFPWAQAIIGLNGKIHQGRCLVGTSIEENESC